MRCNHDDCCTCPHDYCIDENHENNPKDRTEYIKQYQKQNRDEINLKHREIYNQKKSNGICVRCSKIATHGLYCYEHFIAAHRRSCDRAAKEKAERHSRGLIPEVRKQKGLCLWCGKKAIQGMLCCEKHQKIFKEVSQKANHNYWNKDNFLLGGIND